MNLNPRQMILGQYIHAMYQDGLIPRGTPAFLIVKQVSKAFALDVQAVMLVVARSQAADIISKISEMVRGVSGGPTVSPGASASASAASGERNSAQR